MLLKLGSRLFFLTLERNRVPRPSRSTSANGTMSGIKTSSRKARIVIAQQVGKPKIGKVVQ